MTKEKEIQALQNEIAVIQAEIDIQNNNLKIETQRLKANKVSSSVINDYIKAETVIVDVESSEEDIAKNVDIANKLFSSNPALSVLTDPIQQKVNAENDLKYKQAQLKSLQKQDKKEKLETSANMEIPSQEGHLYPVTLVATWTAKLKMYNQQLDNFMSRLEDIMPDVDITWLCKKVESFCRKINYAVAMVRYEIVKGLSSIYKQANVFQQYIDPIANFNPADIFACLGWVKNVINFFLKPYMTVIQFISDFMTYTPPLIAEAGKLVAKAASVPVVAISKIDFVAEGKDGEQKAIADVYKDYIKIQMEPITLGDVMGGNPEKPTYETANMTKKQKEIYDKELEASADENYNIWKELEEYINTASGEDIYVAWPTKLNQLNKQIQYYTHDKNYITRFPEWSCSTAQQAAEQIFGERSAKTKDIYSKTFNSSRHQLYGMYNVDLLRKIMTPTSNLPVLIMGYYEGLYSKVDSKTLESRLKYVEFLKSYTPVFPRIPEFLNKYQDSIVKHARLLEKVSDLDAPSVYD